MSDPTLIRDPIIEAAAVTALLDSQGLTVLGRANAVLAAVTPLIEAAALERAAKVAEEQTYYPDTNIGMRQQWVKDQIAAKVRALKEQP